MSAMILFISVALLFLLNLIYLQIGTHYKIFARNQDQSRRNRIVTGSGIVFLASWVLYFAFNDFTQPFLLFILFGAAVIGFIDDILEVPFFLQLVIHFILFSLLLNQLDFISTLPAFVMIFIIILGLSYMLVVSKHDGMNGLLTSSALVFFGTVIFVLPGMQSISITNPLLYVIFALLAFSSFNFKSKAQLFMGAAGRILLSYLILLFLLHMVFSLPFISYTADEVQENLIKPQYLLFVVVMVVDFIQALIRNKIAGKPFSQLPFLYVTLKEKQVSFLAITMLYGAVQLLVNIVVVYLSLWG
jgi:hypothetical protein